jgi:hypothetical protein
MCLQQFEDKSLKSKIQGFLRLNKKDEESEVENQFDSFYSNLGRNVILNSQPESFGLNKNLSLENVFTIVYVFVDDAYNLLFGSQSFFRLSPNNAPAFTDSEVITIALVSELAGFASRNSWWNASQQELSCFVS